MKHVNPQNLIDRQHNDFKIERAIMGTRSGRQNRISLLLVNDIDTAGFTGELHAD